MIALYQLEHSPFCIAVTALFRALGQPLKVVNVPSGDRRQIIELTGGAGYEVPVLVNEGDGRVICETAADTQNVARYIDRELAGGRLFPGRLEGLQSLLLSHLENEVEGVTFRLGDPYYVDSIADLGDRMMIIRHKERKFGRGCVEEWRREADSLWDTVRQLLAPYEQIAASTPFLLGEEPVYADYLLYGILGNLTYKGHHTLPAEFRALAAWRSRLEAARL